MCGNFFKDVGVFSHFNHLKREAENIKKKMYDVGFSTVKLKD